MKNKMIVTGALFAFLAVLFGAFGAHALHNILMQNSTLDTFETAVRYHFYHSFAILIVAIFYERMQIKNLRIAFYLFSLGIIVFSGSLYILSLTNILILGAITPIGGLCFLIGWGLVLISFWGSKTN
ncbi:MAG: DUF423 domain-containing protein [Candidatus Kapabacteria bacterium]|nr:DUF423 domain-containing protein [Candidatus Kapabacteria bacterium]